MTYQELQKKADFSDSDLMILKESEKVQKGDFLEWSRDSFTSIDEGSPYIGKAVFDVHDETGMWLRSGAGSVFKKRIMRIKSPNTPKVNS